MSAEEVVALLREEGSDTAEIEAKAAHGGYPEGLASTLSAFGNMPGGGLVVLGVDENHGNEKFAVAGVYDAADAQQRLGQQARTAVSPPVQITTTTSEIGGKPVVLAAVRELPTIAKPCEVTRNGIAYLRSYDGDFSISDLERQGFVAARGVSRYDRDPVEDATHADLDEGMVSRYLAACRTASPRLGTMGDTEILAQTRITTPEGVPTMGGLYALGYYPQRFFPTLSVTAYVAQSPGDPTGTRSTDIEHMDGPLPELLDRAVAWVHRNTRTRVRFGDDGHGRDEPEFPALAVRELVANALIHRDIGPHALGDRVTLVLDRGRLVITNPGGLHGITRDQLGTRISGSARNQSLYDIRKNVRTADGRRIIEGIGSGIATIRNALSEAGMTPPHFMDQGIRFTAMVPDHTLLDPDTARHVLALMRQGVTWTNGRLREQFPMDTTEARDLLMDLVNRGLAVPRGDTRGRS